MLSFTNCKTKNCKEQTSTALNYHYSCDFQQKIFYQYLLFFNPLTSVDSSTLFQKNIVTNSMTQYI